MTDQTPNGRLKTLEDRVLACEQEGRKLRNGYGEAVSKAHARIDESNRDNRSALDSLRVQMEADDKELHQRIDAVGKAREPRWFEIALVKRGVTFVAIIILLVLLTAGIINWDFIERFVGLAESVGVK